MKKILLVMMLAGSASLMFGQDFGFKSAGVVAGANMDTSTFKFTSGGSSSEITLKDTLLVGGAFIDFNLIEAQVLYSVISGKVNFKSVTPSTTTESDGDSQYKALNVRVAGKYPIAVGPVTFFPLVGIEYDYSLDMKDRDSFTAKQKEQFNDFMLVLGAGADIPVAGAFFLRPEVRCDINLTPNMFDMTSGLPASVTYTEFGYRLGGSLAVGYAF